MLDRRRAIDAHAEQARAAKVVSWYDNEWGFSCRMVDPVTYMASRR